MNFTLKMDKIKRKKNTFFGDVAKVHKYQIIYNVNKKNKLFCFIILILSGNVMNIMNVMNVKLFCYAIL